MNAKFRVEPSGKNFKVEIFWEEDGINILGKDNIPEEELDLFIDEFRHQYGPYQMTQILPNREKVIE